jgi:hypothetical protein
LKRPCFNAAVEIHSSLAHGDQPSALPMLVVKSSGLICLRILRDCAVTEKAHTFCTAKTLVCFSSYMLCPFCPQGRWRTDAHLVLSSELNSYLDSSKLSGNCAMQQFVKCAGPKVGASHLPFYARACFGRQSGVHVEPRWCWIAYELNLPKQIAQWARQHELPSCAPTSYAAVTALRLIQFRSTVRDPFPLLQCCAVLLSSAHWTQSFDRATAADSAF